MIIDGGGSHAEFLRATGLGWRHQIDAVTAFIDRDNINELIAAAVVEGDIGLLSVDIDGNDYWVLERIDVVSPRILIVEYNSTFGPDLAVTVLYDPGFVRGEQHASWLYWGASLAALTAWPSARATRWWAATARQQCVLRATRRPSRPARGVCGRGLRAQPLPRVPRADGQLSFVSDHRDRLALFADMPLWDLDRDAAITVGELLGGP